MTVALEPQPRALPTLPPTPTPTLTRSITPDVQESGAERFGRDDPALAKVQARNEARLGGGGGAGEGYREGKRLGLCIFRTWARSSKTRAADTAADAASAFQTMTLSIRSEME